MFPSCAGRFQNPSLASARKTYVPGLLKVARTTHLLSGGRGGGVQPTDQGEFLFKRRSSQVSHCEGSNVTAFASPRNTSQLTLRPRAPTRSPLPRCGAG